MQKDKVKSIFDESDNPDETKAPTGNVEEDVDKNLKERVDVITGLTGDTEETEFVVDDPNKLPGYKKQEDTNDKVGDNRQSVVETEEVRNENPHPEVEEEHRSLWPVAVVGSILILIASVLAMIFILLSA